MILLLMLNSIIIICFIISLIIIYFPLSIYELMSYSSSYDYLKDLENKYNDNKIKEIILFLSESVIYKTQGNITFDFNNNSITIKVSGNTYVFDIDKDISKYLPMVLLAE